MSGQGLGDNYWPYSTLQHLHTCTYFILFYFTINVLYCANLSFIFTCICICLYMLWINKWTWQRRKDHPRMGTTGPSTGISRAVPTTGWQRNYQPSQSLEILIETFDWPWDTITTTDGVRWEKPVGKLPAAIWKHGSKLDATVSLLLYPLATRGHPPPPPHTHTLLVVSCHLHTGLCNQCWNGMHVIHRVCSKNCNTHVCMCAPLFAGLFSEILFIHSVSRSCFSLLYYSRTMIMIEF